MERKPAFVHPYHGATASKCNAAGSVHLCAVLCVHAVPRGAHCVSGRVLWVPWGTSVYMYVCVRGKAASHCGPPARPSDSWGPLRQLRPTARSDSSIMGSLLLRLPNTHCDTCTHTKRTRPPSLVALSPGAVQPGHSRGHLPFTEGKVTIFDVSIKLPFLQGGVERAEKKGVLSFSTCSFLSLLSAYLNFFV